MFRTAAVLVTMLCTAACFPTHQPTILVTTGKLDYPEAALRNGIQGSVEVQYLVNSDGSTSNLSVVSAEPQDIFDNAAIAFVRTWQFQPFVIDKTPQVLVSTVNFKLESEVGEYVPPAR